MSKIIIITGASGGVGLELIKRFSKKRWKVIGLSRSKKGILPQKIEFYPLDITKAPDVHEVFKNIGQRFNKIDVLINNASIFKMTSFNQCEVNDINNIIDTNLKGAIFCTREALKLMRKGGRIINIASVAATHGIKNQALYCASKYGLDGFAEALNQEVIKDGISISTLYPGAINTPLWNETNPYPGELKKILTPKDIGDAVEYIINLPKKIVLKKLVLFPSNEWH